MLAIEYSPLPDARRGRSRRRRLPKHTLTYNVLMAWFDMRKSTRKLVTERPSEAYLLLLLVLSDIAFFMSWTMKAVIVPHNTGVSLISVEIGVLFIVSFVARTAGMYVFAMVLGAICRLFGGRGTWRNTRIAVFWAALVTAPFGVMAALMSVAFTNLEVYFPIFGGAWISTPPYWLGLLPFVWYTSAGVAKVHGFRKVSPLFLSMSVVFLVGLIGGMYFRARGMI